MLSKGSSTIISKPKKQRPVNKSIKSQNTQMISSITKQDIDSADHSVSAFDGIVHSSNQLLNIQASLPKQTKKQKETLAKKP